MFTHQKNHAQYIYHYTSADTAINYILKNKNLRFSSYKNTNDPKESKDWFFTPGTNEDRNLDRYNPKYLSDIMNPRLKDRTHLLCFSKDQPLTGNHLNDNPKRGFCKPRMWAGLTHEYSHLHLAINLSPIPFLPDCRYSR